MIDYLMIDYLINYSLSIYLDSYLNIFNSYRLIYERNNFEKVYI